MGSISQRKVEAVWDALMNVSMLLHEIEEDGGTLSEPLECLWSKITDYLEWSRKQDGPPGMIGRNQWTGA